MKIEDVELAIADVRVAEAELRRVLEQVLGLGSELAASASRSKAWSLIEELKEIETVVHQEMDMSANPLADLTRSANLARQTLKGDFIERAVQSARIAKTQLADSVIILTELRSRLEELRKLNDLTT